MEAARSPERLPGIGLLEQTPMILEKLLLAVPPEMLEWTFGRALVGQRGVGALGRDRGDIPRAHAENDRRRFALPCELRSECLLRRRELLRPPCARAAQEVLSPARPDSRLAALPSRRSRHEHLAPCGTRPDHCG